MKQAIFNLIYRMCYPHIYFVRNPFKMLEYQALTEGIDFNDSDRILDLGSGHGLQTMLLAKQGGHVIGIDPSENAVNRAKSDFSDVRKKLNCEFRCTTIEGAGFEADSFDKIFSVCVLEHIPDYMSALRECCRVMKPGGILSFSIDSLATIKDPDLLEKHRTLYHVCRYFTKEEIKADFEKAGFRDVRVTPLAVSDYAAKLFAEGIRIDYNFRYSEGVRLLKRLMAEEAKATDRADGIYLIVRATK